MADMANFEIYLIFVAIILCVVFLFLLYQRTFPLKTKTNKFKRNKTIYQLLSLIEKQEGNLESFENNLYKKDSSVGLILGARGSGKSALGMLISENFASKTSKNICAIGFDKSDVPSYIKIIENPDEIPNDSFVLIDEGGIFFSSRDSMKEANKIVSKILLLARHKNLSILFITQNSSNLEINTIRQSDYLLLKPSSLLQLDFERKKIKEIYDLSKKGFEKFKDQKGLVYIYSDDFKGFAANTLPSFWSQKISKTLDDKKIEFNKNKI